MLWGRHRIAHGIAGNWLLVQMMLQALAWSDRPECYLFDLLSNPRRRYLHLN